MTGRAKGFLLSFVIPAKAEHPRSFLDDAKEARGSSPRRPQGGSLNKKAGRSAGGRGDDDE
jgi:hypothetical protein